MSSKTLPHSSRQFMSAFLYLGLSIAALVVLVALVWQGITASGNPDPTTPNLSRGAVILNTGLLVFREGLEAILVMAALTASMMGSNTRYRRPIAAGAGLAFLASIATWFVAIAVLDRVNAPQLHIQAATGLLAIVVLLVIMNWFFHKVYWTGWIAMHNKRRRDLMAQGEKEVSQTMWGFVMLGFSAMY
jgi:high-affinity iron transporter